jgi:hypothetical protein
MTNNPIAYGFFNVHGTFTTDVLHEKLRNFTLCRLRFGYSGPILESENINGVLNDALARGYSYCFVQSAGNLIREMWSPDHNKHIDIQTALESFGEKHNFLLAGVIHPAVENAVHAASVLVNLSEYEKAGKPELALTISDGMQYVNIADDAAQPIPFDGNVIGCQTDVRFENIEQANALNICLEGGIEQYPALKEQQVFNANQVAFLDIVQLHQQNARKGVFVWNLEPYTDVEKRPDQFVAPVGTLYSVAAGFKPNRILETHGFYPATKMVYFDYSPNALRVKQAMIEEWDGIDFPKFIKHLFQKFPYPETYYHLWRDIIPANVDWNDMDKYWEVETARWGGPDVLQAHWEKYSQIEHQFVEASIYDHQDLILDAMDGKPNSIIWWSNAFFTMYSNWHFNFEERRERYHKWIEKLAQQHPSLFIYGSDYNNISVNHLRASQYLQRISESENSYLDPEKWSAMEIRF